MPSHDLRTTTSASASHFTLTEFAGKVLPATPIIIITLSININLLKTVRVNRKRVFGIERGLCN